MDPSQRDRPEEAGERDLDQARLAIEGARALSGLVPQEGLQQVRDALSQLQMAYVQLVQGAEGGGQGPEGEGPPAPDSAADDEAERAKARAKIWTPPGA